MDEIALYYVNSDDHSGDGGGNAQFYSEENFSLQIGKSFASNCRDGFVVSSNRFRIIPINKLTTFWIKMLPN